MVPLIFLVGYVKEAAETAQSDTETVHCHIRVYLIPPKNSFVNTLLLGW